MLRRTAAAMAALVCCVAVSVVGTSAATPSAQATATAASATAAPVDGDELKIRIKRLGSTYIERGEPVVIRAKVTNRSEHRWHRAKAYLVISGSPITDAASVKAAAQSSAETPSGHRVTSGGTFTRIGRLGRGESKTFTIRVPFKRLPIDRTNGVYQVGVHVLATDEDGNRDSDNTLGRVRTFMPYFNDRTASRDPLHVSTVWPFTAPIRRDPDGAYPDAEELVDLVSPTGRLGRMLHVAEDANVRSITVLIDPALVEALSAIAVGNFGPPESGSQSQTLQPQELSTGSDSPQRIAKEFLTALNSLAKSQDVWITPYAQPDLDALTQHGRNGEAAGVYKATETTARSVAKRFGVEGRIAYMPPDGVADLDSLLWAQSNTDTSDPSRPGPVAILAPKMLTDWDDSESPVLSLDAGNYTLPTVVDNDAIMEGGPRPGKTDSALQVRQRLASEVALRAIERSADPSTSSTVGVVIDPEWNPGPRARRIDMFDVESPTWVTATSPERELNTNPPNWRGPVGVPGDTGEPPVPDDLVDAAADIVRATDDLASVLGGGQAMRDYYGGSAGMVMSQNWRSDPIDAESYAEDAAEAATTPLQKVRIEGPGFVSFSGNSGRLPITIHNGLDVPIKVGVAIRAKSDTISIPDMPPKEIAPGQSPSFTIDANIGEISNTAFTATLVTPDGQRFGEPAQFAVRSSVVGTAIWIGMGIAGVLVVIALVRQIRRRRATPSPADEPAP